MMYQRGMNPSQVPDWFITISRSESEPAIITTAAIAMPYDSS